MVEPEIVRQIRALTELGWGMRRVAHELGVDRKTVRRYLRPEAVAGVQVRPRRRALDDEGRAKAVSLFDTTAGGNAVVVQQLLAEEGIDVDVRVVQRAVAPHRLRKRAAQAATVRFETEPGHQLQIDFGEQWIIVGGVRSKVHVFVAVLGYSRRRFVKAFRRQQHDDWREGLAGAFLHFGGVTQTVLVDNAKALIIEHVGDDVRIHPGFKAFCDDWGVDVRACKPYRARTKGKTERGVGYVKHNALAAREFASWAALEAHLVWWMSHTDELDHGTTHERPRARFDAAEAVALRPLPPRPIPVRQRRESRRVATDCFVDIDTVRYSVPHRLVRRTVEVLVGDAEVLVYDGPQLVARHPRCAEAHQRVIDRAHFEGLCRVTTSEQLVRGPIATYSRDLAVYAAAIGGAA